MKNNQWTVEEDNILRDRYTGISCCPNLNIGRSASAIKKRAFDLGIKVGYKNLFVKSTSVDEEYFKTPNIRNSYYAGLIASDGYIHNVRDILALYLTDKILIENFKQEILYTGTMSERKRNIGKTVYGVSICNNIIVNDLINTWNITRKKTFTLAPPTLSEELSLSYIVGLIDGDGWLCVSKNGILEIGCCGSYEIISWMSNILNTRMFKKGNIFTTSASNKKARQICKMLYDINTPMKLSRKWDKVKEMI